MKSKYDDMLLLPPPTSPRHPRMSIANRAAQFSPFAALNGHDEAIHETARLTDGKIELAEDEKLRLDRKMRVLTAMLSERPEVVITHYIPDLSKDGGAYVIFTGNLRKIDPTDHTLCFTDGTMIAPEDVLSLDSPHLKNIFDI